MFAAAILDAWPELGAELVATLRAAGLASDVSVRWEPVRDEVLAGTRFVVDDPRERKAVRPAHQHVLAIDAAQSHAHVAFTDIKQRIDASPLAATVKERALDIFVHIARAEAAVHGLTDVEAVVLHEVGAQDSRSEEHI